ncbi:MAG: hypothetical protein JWL86_5407 [Rhizobium sp.]|nr:hypothetical protein [Rhizobium sp.]
MDNENRSREHDGTREVEHETNVLSFSTDAPRVRIKPKPQAVVLSPPTADFGVKS